MRIFYILSTILLLLSNSSRAQERNNTPPFSDKQPVPRITRFYPNPAVSYITFDLQQGEDARNYSFQIYSMVGKKMYETNNINNKTTVNLSEFYRGIYIFQLRDKTGKVIDSGKFQVSK
ncbi:MAG: T9SS type A sorting domain-containing protein [Chitinophagaceae bacterium]